MEEVTLSRVTDFDLQLDVECDKCSKDLEFSTQETKTGVIRIFVKPCDCVKEEGTYC